MALFYGYLFPTIFLVAFWVLYRHEQVPLVGHMGELLTVTALGGACFGLPTAMVRERERGVWRRYRLAPVHTASLTAATIVSRYFLLLTAALLQLALALAVGMPMPDHPLDLWVAFTFVSFSFLGLGLVIAMMADNVPAVQALGQCIFLPMLIIGGIAVRIESLPVWAQHTSAFFPGRYAVDALQMSVNGDGLGGAGFSLLALLLIGIAACVSGAKLFRWDAQERFAARKGKGWVVAVLAAWIAVGTLAESRGRVVRAPSSADRGIPTSVTAPLASSDTSAGAEPQETVGSAPEAEATESDQDEESRGADIDGAETEVQEERQSVGVNGAEMDLQEEPQGAPPDSVSSDPQGEPAGPPASWQAVTAEDIDRDVHFDRLPPDQGVVAPIASANESIYPETARQLDCLRSRLPFWNPGRVADPVQRVRNFLYIAAVPDMFQLDDLERWAPKAVFDHLQSVVSQEELIKILYWVAVNPAQGDHVAAGRLPAVCIDVGGPSDVETLEERTSMYALKLLGRLTGRISPN